jgi:hypothetical protein
MVASYYVKSTTTDPLICPKKQRQTKLTCRFRLTALISHGDHATSSINLGLFLPNFQVSTLAPTAAGGDYSIIITTLYPCGNQFQELPKVPDPQLPECGKAPPSGDDDNGR